MTVQGSGFRAPGLVNREPGTPNAEPMPTIAQAITEGAARLHAAGIDQDRRTAGLLLCHVMGIDRTHLLTRSKEQIDEAQYREYLALIERRAAGEPLQYLTGHQEFYGLNFIVTPDVLIPRPETEYLVEQIVKLSRQEAKAQSSQSHLIVDTGTGSGCIAITLAINIPNSRVIGIDISTAALEVAKENAAKHGVTGRVEFLQGNLLEPLAAWDLEGRVDFIASNPPYVPGPDLERLQREIREHEPRVALYGGSDGLDFYRRLLTGSQRFLRPEGHLVCEIGFSQLSAIRDLIDSARWDLLEVTKDLQGIPRTLTIRQR